MAEVSKHPQQALGETTVRNLDELGNPGFDRKKRKKENMYNFQLGASHLNQSCDQRFSVQSGTVSSWKSHLWGSVKLLVFTLSGSGTTSPEQSPKFQSRKNVGRTWSNWIILPRIGATGSS